MSLSIKLTRNLLFVLRKHLIERLENANISPETRIAIELHERKAAFYEKLESFGYILMLKPVKRYANERKANCDVDMTLMLLEKKDGYDRAIIMSGDGDFLPVLKRLRSEGKEIIIVSRATRTAKEIRQFAGGDFRDFEYLRESLQMRR